MKYNHILFDLDGTLTDPALGITNSVMYALKYFGIDETDRTLLYKFIGPPLLDSFRDFYGFDEEKSKLAMKKYREYYVPKGLYENKVYDGVENMLANLKSSGKKLYVATSKPEEYAVKILEHFNLLKYFEFCGGSDIEETRARKAEVIKYVLEKCGLSEKKDECLMVGDRKHDVLGAKEAGLDCMGVLYGYGSRDELREAGAKYIVESVRDVQVTIGNEK